MAVLVRKITRSKWQKDAFVRREEVCADAITSCLRTSGNTLSFWYDANDQDPNDAILAILASLERIDSIDCIFIPVDKILDSGLQLEETRGSTAATTLQATHRDIKNLNYKTLGVVSDLIKKEVISDKVKRISKQSFIDRIEAAINNKVIDTSLLKESMLSELKTKGIIQ
jgi:hypothetical protein